MRHPVALLAVTPAVCQHEVVTEINRVLGPRDEMIDVAAVAPNRLRAVETFPVLQVHQHRPDRSQRVPFRSEQELPQVQRLSKQSPFKLRTSRSHADRTAS